MGMKRLFIVVLVLAAGSMLGCDKEIKEAVRPAPQGDLTVNA
jgi:hypothetical protein